MINALVFPGQGSQEIGMGKVLAESFSEAHEVFGEVDEALKQKLFALMTSGDPLALQLTENAQPAIMAVSMAVVRVLQKQGNYRIHELAKYVAGHSLGEYSALCAAGTFSLADTARLLKIRGTAMQQAVPVGVGAMAALLGVDTAQVQEILDQVDGICCIANDNANGQVVISGHKAAVEAALAEAAVRGAKRSVLLNVSAPFHSPLMQQAAERMAEALQDVSMHKPAVPVIANITAQPVQDADAIRTLLVAQVTGRVRWRESVLQLSALGAQQQIEVGHGKVLTGLAKRIAPEMQAISLQTPQDIDTFLTHQHSKEEQACLA